MPATPLPAIASKVWRAMAYRLDGDRLMVPTEDWRSVLPAGSTVGTPAMEAVYGANYSDVTGGEVAYWKDPWGVVYVQGLVKRTAGIAAGQTILTMPEGYRPVVQVGFAQPTDPIVNVAHFTNVRILVSGVIGCNGFSNAAQSEARTYLSLVYRAKQDTA